MTETERVTTATASTPQTERLMNPPGRRPRTVLLALDALPRQWAMEAAFNLARQMNARLEGLFVEDLNLLRLAQLPFSQEIVANSAQRRPLGSAALEQALRSQAGQLQRLLAQQAAAQRIECGFSVVRDHLLRAVRNAAREADLFIIEGQRFQQKQSSPGRNLGPAVAAVYDGHLAPIETAGRLARGGSVRVLLMAHRDGARDAIKAQLHALGANPLFVVLADNGAETLRGVVRRHGTSLLVIPAALLAEGDDSYQPLLEELPCTVVVMDHPAPQEAG